MAEAGEAPQPSEYTPFHPDLDQGFPVGTLNLHDEDKAAIVRGGIQPLQWVSFFRSSPAQNSEAEALMGTFVTDALRAGQWVDVESPQDQMTEPVTHHLPDGNSITVGSIPLEYKRGAELLTQVGFVQKATQGGRTFLQPTEQLTKFIEQRIGFTKPQGQV